MATVTQLADRVCQNTGLLTTGTERTLVIQALNDAYQRAVEESGCYRVVTTATLTSGQAGYDWSSDLSVSDALRIVSIRVDGSTDDLPLRAVSEAEFRRLSLGNQSNGTPIVYCQQGTNRVSFYPTPDGALNLDIDYLGEPPVLVESGPSAGEESTPSAIPKRFHWDVLAAGAIVQGLNKDQRGADSDRWESRYERGLAALMAWANMFSGEPAPLEVLDRGFGQNDPDYYAGGA